MGNLIKVRRLSTGRDDEFAVEIVDGLQVRTELQVATAAEITTGTVKTKLVTPGELSGSTLSNVPAASSTVAGLIELAIQSEANTGTAADRAVTPGNLPGAVKTHAGLVSAPMAAAFVVAAETGGNTRNVAIQLNDAAGDPLTLAAAVKAYFSDNSDGSTLIATMPNGGVSIGTDGLIIPGAQSFPDGVLLHGHLAIGSDPIKFQTTQSAAYVINGISHTKAATDALVFTAAHVITASKFGIIRLQINEAGTISSKVPVTPQVYNDAPTALAAIPAVDAGNVSLGYIAIENNAGDWTANTDDLTNGSDLTTAVFTDATEIASGVPKVMDLVSEPDGDIDINIVESGVKAAFYLVLILASGKLSISGAISFA